MISFNTFNVFLIPYILYGVNSVASLEVFQQRVVVNSSELCIIPINPSHLRWEKQPGSIKEIEYSTRMSNSPDLPEWLKYTYDGHSSTGYIYGVPPIRLGTLNLDVIGWNRYDNYDVRQLIISLEIMRKEPMEYILEIKIDNLNIRDLCNSRRMTELRDILAEHLDWKKKDGNGVVPVYMASAVAIGENRVPLRPNEAEGVVIHFASDKDFAPALKKLQVEISPLWKLRPCPRDMKRTSVERHFRRYKFFLDWCSLRLTVADLPSGSEEQGKKGSPKSSATGSNGEAVVDETLDFVNGKGRYVTEPENFIFKSIIPERTYGYEALLATILPGSIGGLIGIVLIALLWADREEESVNDDALFFEAAFRMLYSLTRFNNDASGGANYSYHQINRQQQEDNVLLTREAVIKVSDPVVEPQPTVDREMMSTPMPPQYSETHPKREMEGARQGGSQKVDFFQSLPSKWMTPNTLIE